MQALGIIDCPAEAHLLPVLVIFFAKRPSLAWVETHVDLVQKKGSKTMMVIKSCCCHSNMYSDSNSTSNSIVTVNGSNKISFSQDFKTF